MAGANVECNDEGGEVEAQLKDGDSTACIELHRFREGGVIRRDKDDADWGRFAVARKNWQWRSLIHMKEWILQATVVEAAC